MRVVSLTCSNTEILGALGLGASLVGVDDHSDWPPEVIEGVPRVGPDLAIDIDAVERLAPDLVLASLTVPGHERIVDALQRRRIPHLAPAPTSLDDVARDIRAIGSALGVPERGEAVARRFEGDLAGVPVIDDPPRILVEWWPRPVYVPGGRSWITQLAERAGGCNPFADRDVESLAAEPAEVVAAAPDAVVVAWCGVPFERYRLEVVRRRPGWEAVPAVRTGRVVAVPEAWLGRPGPRLVQGLEALKRIVADVMEARALEEAPCTRPDSTDG